MRPAAAAPIKCRPQQHSICAVHVIVVVFDEIPLVCVEVNPPPLARALPCLQWNLVMLMPSDGAKSVLSSINPSNKLHQSVLFHCTTVSSVVGGLRFSVLHTHDVTSARRLTVESRRFSGAALFSRSRLTNLSLSLSLSQYICGGPNYSMPTCAQVGLYHQGLVVVKHTCLWKKKQQQLQWGIVLFSVRRVCVWCVPFEVYKQALKGGR